MICSPERYSFILAVCGFLEGFKDGILDIHVVLFALLEKKKKLEYIIEESIERWINIAEALRLKLI